MPKPQALTCGSDESLRHIVADKASVVVHDGQRGVIQCGYLPPYSPDLNPIEKLWSKIKALLRKFKARSPDALPNAIQHAFQNVSPSDCSGWFRSCGYAL